MKKLFTLLILLLLLPVTALAEGTAPATLHVGSTTITAGYWTSSDGGTTWARQENQPEGNNYIYYDGQGTLELHNVTIQGQTFTGSAPFGAGIYAECGSGQSVALTIELIGTNTITGYYGIHVNAHQGDTIGADASLIIKSSNNGSLTVTGTDDSGLFILSGTGGASLTIENASVNAKTTSGNSFYAGVCVQSGLSATGSPNISLAVDGGSLTASGTGSSDGIQFVVGSSQATNPTTKLTVGGNAIVDARNGGIVNNSSSQVQFGTGSDSTGGIVFDGSAGTVYGTVELQNELTIGAGETLTVPDGSSLNCNGNLTNSGTINVESGGNLEGEPTSGTGTVVKTPTITTQPTSQTVNEGETATFTVVATGSDLSYQWQQSTDNGSTWKDISENATDATYTIGQTRIDMNGYQYRCVLKNSIGEVTSDAATLTVPTICITIVMTDNTQKSYYSAKGSTFTEYPTGYAFFFKENGTQTWINKDTQTYDTDTTIYAENMTLERIYKKDPTCTENGNSEYWYCAAFDKYFKDENGVNEITYESTVIPATGHSLTEIEAKAATCTENGNIEYWYCANCAKCFSDENATEELTDVVIPATGHHYVNGTCTECGQRDPDYRPDPISYYNIYVEDVCDGVEVSLSKSVVKEGNSISVYVEKDTANYTFDNFKVYYKRSYYGPWEVLEEGVQPGEYPIRNIWTHIYIKAEGAEEKEEDPTGIEQVEGVKVYAKDGSLYVQTPQREQVLIISMTGVVVKNEEQVGLKQYQGLQPGIYIVRVGDRAYKLRL